MTNETNLRSKALYKITLYVLKMLPMIMAFSYLIMFVLANTIESFVIIPHIIGTVIAPLVFVYLTSYVFRFCAFHRLFIHYYAFVELLNVTDYYVRIPISDAAITFIHDSVTIVFLILAVVMYIYKYKKDKCLKQYNNKEYDFRNS
jgi:hypothetical protein